MFYGLSVVCVWCGSIFVRCDGVRTEILGLASFGTAITAAVVSWMLER